MMMIRTLLALAAVTGSGIVDSRTERRDWSVVTVTYGGNVSIVRNLSLHDAASTADGLEPFSKGWRLSRYIDPPSKTGGSHFGLGLRATKPKPNYFSIGGVMHQISDGDIKSVYVIGPAGWQENCFFSFTCR